MTQWAIVDSDGCIVEAWTGTARAGAHEVPVEWAVLPPDRIYWFTDGGDWAMRPEAAAPDLVGTVATISGCPDGAAAIVSDAVLHVELANVPAVDGQIELEFMEPGSYAVEVVFPQPYRSRRVLVEVS